MEDVITISMEEYKELLMIKGKYEELKQNTFTWIGTSSNPLRESPYGGPTVTYCNKKE